jgi:hypothetical protein
VTKSSDGGILGQVVEVESVSQPLASSLRAKTPGGLLVPKGTFKAAGRKHQMAEFAR